MSTHPLSSFTRAKLLAGSPLYKALDHIAVVVQDTDAALAIWGARFGFPVLFQEKVNDGSVLLTHLDLGNTHLQLVQPLTQDHPLQQWLRKHGSGLHHFCLTVENVDTATAAATAAGLPPAAHSHQGTRGNRAVFLDLTSTNGVQVEITGR